MFEYILVPEPTDEHPAILSEAFKCAMRATSPSAALQALIEYLGNVFCARRAYIYELPQDGAEFVCAFEWCAPGVEPMSDVTHGLTREMAARWFGDGEERSLLVINDVSSVAKVNPQYAALFGPRSMKSQILGKLTRGTLPLGTLGFDDPDPQKKEFLCQAMYPICAFATATMNTRNLLNKMNTVGLVDKLTGTGTRMAFYQKAEQIPANVSMGMGYLDIVGLQGVNDVHGYDAGNELLVAVRQALITEFKDDQVFRMAGGEFLVAVPGIDEATFREAMSRIRALLSELTAYVALGVRWWSRLGTEYDTLVRETWLACNNDKHEWERRGGKRFSSNEDVLEQFDAYRPDDPTDDGTYLNIPCYRGDEFFRRAHIWANHMESKGVGMIAFDINYFKLYNDLYGREAGDLLLETCGKTISQLAADVHGIAGYFGGDNFCMVFPVNKDFEIEDVCKKIESELGRFITAEGFAPSVGVVATKDHSVGLTVLYDRALVALSTVKGNYTSHVAYYDANRYERERQNQLLLIRAREGIKNGEFTFYLQPKVDIITNKVVSAEALVRWIHNGKVVPPFEFVGLMERTGYIFALDRYVWNAVFAWQRSLMDRGIDPVPVSVNVSRVDFYFADLNEHFNKLVKKYRVPPRLVGIEVTESAYANDPDVIIEVIDRLHNSGFAVFMDDFGSGYSSLNMLRSVGVDALKIDKGFIDSANIKDGEDAIISSVITMAHKMGLPVISEGVETEEQRDMLRTMACDYVQGYFYYRPMTIDAFEAILTSGEVVAPHGVSV